MRAKGIFRGTSCARQAALAVLVIGVSAVTGPDARAAVLKNEIAVFAALDKVTGRIKHLEVPINQTVEFGALKVTPRVCNSRPVTEKPDTSTFVEVDEVNLAGEQQRIFTGWMFAESPGLHAVEHPVFDVWLTNCKEPIGGVPAETAEEQPADATAAAAAPAAPAPAAPPAAGLPPATPPQAAQPAPPAAPPAARRPRKPILPWLR